MSMIALFSKGYILHVKYIKRLARKVTSLAKVDKEMNTQMLNNVEKMDTFHTSIVVYNKLFTEQRFAQVVHKKGFLLRLGFLRIV